MHNKVFRLFKDGQKHGNFLRYDRKDEVAYDEYLQEGKLIRKVK